MLDKLHPDLRPHANALLDVITFAQDVCGDLDAIVAEIERRSGWRNAMEWAQGHIARGVRLQGGSVFSLPFLHPDYCRQLVAHAERLGDYAPNPAEDLDYQIPEIVLAHRDPELFETLKSLGVFIMTWSALIWLKVPARVSSIQFAKYEPHGTAHGNWHFDASSDYSAVVSLDPTTFTGGGTDMRDGLAHYATIDPLPAGYILFFDGRKIMHRGRGVDSGRRHLLVYWLSE